MIRIKRVYHAPGRSDGVRILVDRLWPRGLKKEQAKVDLWLKDVAPSRSLRQWFAHAPERWDEFKKRYAEELAQREPVGLQKILEYERKGTVTLLFGAREERYNNAVALAEYLHLHHPAFA